MIRLSENLRSRWSAEIAAGLAEVSLEVDLRALVDAAFVRRGESLLLAPLARNCVFPEALDAVGVEAFVNKFHVEDYVRDELRASENFDRLFLQAAKAALLLAERLVPLGSFRVLLSVDRKMATAVLRFFHLRAALPWGPDAPNELTSEEVLMVDTGARDDTH